MSPYGNPPGAPQGPQTLESFLAQRGPLAAHELVPLLGSVMDQLGTLHAGGQHHGNLSTDTITVTPTPQGNMAAWLPPSTPFAAGAWPSYQSPEQLAEGGQVGYWSDVYAMAAVVYRALVGQPPFMAPSPEEVRQAHLQSPPPQVTAQRPDLAPELDGVIQQGLAKAPADRQASIQAFRQSVETASMAAPPPAAAFAPAGPDPAAPAGMPPAPAPAAPDYVPAAVPLSPTPAAPVPPPATMVQPTAIPKAKSGAPMVAIIAGISVLGVVGGMVMMLLAKGQGESNKSSSSAKVADPAPEERARPRAAKNVMRPVAMRPDPKPLALPAVGDKIKNVPAPSGALAGGAGPHYRVDIAGQPFRGALKAPVVLALYSDFQCPYCTRVPKILNGLLQKYPRDLKVVWFDFPLSFHKQAMPAAIAARAVYLQKGSGGFWKMHDKIFANYRSISTDSLKTWARDTGADPNKVEKDLQGTAIRGTIEKRMAYAKQIGVRGTPTMLINGVRYRGKRSVEGFSEVIDAELAKVQRAVKAGKTTRADYYAHLMKSGQTRKVGGAKPTTKRKRRKVDPSVVYRIPVFKDDVWKGAKRPLVTLVLWSDFQCPYCKGMACTLEQILKKYKRTVRLVYRHHPLSFHKQAMPAAEAAEAARAIKGRKGFWRMYALLFPLKLCLRKNSRVKIRDWQRKIRDRQPKLTRSSLDRYARKLRLRKSKYRRYMDRHTHRRRIQAQATASKALDARGTPALFVNGRYVRGYRPYGKLRVIIDQELKKARRLIKSGVKRRKLYNHITARGARKLVYLP